MYDPDAEWRWNTDTRLTDLEDDVTEIKDGPWQCDECTRPYNSRSAAERCCDDVSRFVD